MKDLTLSDCFTRREKISIRKANLCEKLIDAKDTARAVERLTEGETKPFEQI